LRGEAVGYCDYKVFGCKFNALALEEDKHSEIIKFLED